MDVVGVVDAPSGASGSEGPGSCSLSTDEAADAEAPPGVAASLATGGTTVVLGAVLVQHCGWAGVSGGGVCVTEGV